MFTGSRGIHRVFLAATTAIGLGLSPTVARAAAEADAWFDFNPGPEPLTASPIDLRFLNEASAGEHGFITTRGDEFVRGSTGQPVRFWAVNGPPASLSGPALDAAARRLARYGVNLTRLHSAIFDASGAADPKKIARAQATVAALKAAGIYSHFSIYFPLWMTPATDHPWLKGYDGKKHPFAALMFNPEFQEHYRNWWRALLLTPDARGRRLVDEPAVFGLEIQNEDSFFFWTFNPDQIPDAQLRLLEARFATWLQARHGSLETALARWQGVKVRRDDPAAGRIGFRPLYNIFTDKSARDRDTAQFLFEVQRGFYEDTIRFLRGLGFKGLITPSNWSTASPEVFGPLEKWSYTTGDFVDRHGYFSVAHKGDNAEWSLRNGHTYADRSALRFEAASPGKPRQFVHPAMDPTYAGKPSMISETTWNRPNRYRSEAPFYYAAFGALQGTDAIVHFALDGAEWSVKPGFWMQPWTLMAPSQFGQFPAAAMIYRRGLVGLGDVVARVQLNTNDLLQLRGTPLPQDASFDELRLKDVPRGVDVRPGQRLDPLLHYVGRTAVEFTGAPTRVAATDTTALVDHAAGVVRSSTGELRLDYQRGILTINAPSAQGASGNLGAAGPIDLTDFVVESPLNNVHLVLVALDNEPLARSRRVLLQVMSEERATGFATIDGGNGLKKITNIGRDPWQVKSIAGQVRFKGGPAPLIQPLDFNGQPRGEARRQGELALDARTVYYLITR